MKRLLLTALAALSLATGLLITDAPKAEAACVVNVESWDRLNARSGPGTSYGVRFSIRPGNCGVDIIGPCEGRWCRIQYRGMKGWVNTRFIGSEDEGGDDSIGRQARFNQPRYDGIRLDARRYRYEGFDMVGTANRFCRSKGFGGMVDYRVQTSRRTIAMGDGFIFNNGPSSNTTYRYIVCE